MEEREARTYKMRQVVEITGVPESTLRVWERNAITAKALLAARREVPINLAPFLDFPVPERKPHRRRDRVWTEEELDFVRQFADARGYVPD